jgi:hypothetical protein
MYLPQPTSTHVDRGKYMCIQTSPKRDGMTNKGEEINLSGVEVSWNVIFV